MIIRHDILNDQQIARLGAGCFVFYRILWNNFHFNRIEFPSFINWTSQLPRQWLLGGIFHFRTFCKQTAENAASDLGFQFLSTFHKKDATLTMKKFDTFFLYPKHHFLHVIKVVLNV